MSGHLLNTNLIQMLSGVILLNGCMSYTSHDNMINSNKTENQPFNPDLITGITIVNDYETIVDVKVDIDDDKDPHISPFEKGGKIELIVSGTSPDEKKVHWNDGRVIREISLNDDDQSDDFQMPNSGRYDFNIIKYQAGQIFPNDLFELIDFNNNTYTPSVIDIDGIGGRRAAKIDVKLESDHFEITLISASLPFDPDVINKFIIVNDYGTIDNVKVNVANNDPHIEPFERGDRIELSISGVSPDEKKVLWSDGRVIREISLNNDDQSDDFQLPNSGSYDFNIIKYKAGQSLPDDLYELVDFNNNTYSPVAYDFDGIDHGPPARIRVRVEGDALVATIKEL
ncbi:hypothetical protein [Zooshikella sp. RANM57]|uniref:hypothetical protein n=1 Tax=Zooshikella sp. RANM57 TaxID=3425863 RepID=UPI003D6E76BE